MKLNDCYRTKVDSETFAIPILIFDPYSLFKLQFFLKSSSIIFVVLLLNCLLVSVNISLALLIDQNINKITDHSESHVCIFNVCIFNEYTFTYITS